MSPLSDASRRALLEIARRSIASAFREGAEEPGGGPEDPALEQQAGAFVTLHEEGELRGCIGTFEGRGSLRRTLAEMARSAAFDDSRFPPLTAGELPRVDIEISVLTPMRRLRDPGEVEVGRHGLCIAQGYRRGVLLPQVATDYGWDRETFLAQTCRKAGLPQDAWQHGAEIYVFEAEVFGEKG